MELKKNVQGAIENMKPWEGRLTCNFYDPEGRLVESRFLGKNLVVNNAKLVMSHLLGQYATPNVINGVKAFDPRINSESTGRLNGGVPISISGWNPTPAQLRPLYMGFGSNLNGATAGANPGITQSGLYNIVGKTGIEGGQGGTQTIASYFYGGTTGDNAFVIQYIANADGISDAWVRFITRMKTFQGQTASGGATQIYREAGLFTTLFVPSTAVSPTESAPIMIARKTFPEISKTSALETEWVWEIRF